jgi:hypothetical protein
LALQVYSLKIYGGPLILTIVIRILSKAYRIELNKLKYYGGIGSLLEIVGPILALCFIIYFLNSFPLSEPVINPLVTDYFERVFLLALVMEYLLLTILHWTVITIYKLGIWVYRHKGQEFLEIFEELSTKLGKRFVRIAFFPSLILTVVLTLVIYLDIIVNLEVLAMIVFFNSWLLYYFILNNEIEYLQESLDGEKSKNILIAFLDVNAKIAGLLIFIFIILFITMYSIVYPFLLTLIERILLLDFYPSIFYEFLSYQDLEFLIIAFGRLQLLGCIALIGFYWITKGMILKFEPNYKNKISKDIVIFVVVTAFSEYLTWSYQFFFENVTYSSHMLLVSVLIGMTASILSALLEDIWPR